MHLKIEQTEADDSVYRTDCVLLVRKSNTHSDMCVLTFIAWSLYARICGCIVLKADEKSAKRILA